MFEIRYDTLYFYRRELQFILMIFSHTTKERQQSKITFLHKIKNSVAETYCNIKHDKTNRDKSSEHNTNTPLNFQKKLHCNLNSNTFK